MGHVRYKRGKVNYSMQVGTEIWVMHVNQLLEAGTERLLREQLSVVVLLLDMLVDTRKPEGPQQTPKHEPRDSTRNVAAQRTKRRRKFVSSILVNPRLKFYSTVRRRKVFGR